MIDLLKGPVFNASTASQNHPFLDSAMVIYLPLPEAAHNVL